jgi:gliding motility-associated-like protein
MKRILVVASSLFIIVFLVMCKKKTTPTTPPKNNATCTTCSGTPLIHKPDAAGVFYYVPTAFTPNGDGLNDLFRVFYDKLDTAKSIVTIWDTTGVEVFNGKITKSWDGFDIKGARCPAGKYPVYVQLTDVNGTVTNTCTCVTLLKYTGNCIVTNGTAYFFPDQIELTTGFSFATNDKLCP